MITSEFVEQLVLFQGESAGKVSMTAVAYCVEIPIAGGSPRQTSSGEFFRQNKFLKSKKIEPFL